LPELLFLIRRQRKQLVDQPEYLQDIFSSITLCVEPAQQPYLDYATSRAIIVRVLRGQMRLHH